jgi:hypothetical protein
MSEFFARNWGNLASVIGLVFSALAVVFSRRASQAAKEARDAVLRRSLGEEMNELNRAAVDIVMNVDAQRDDMALVRVSELLNPDQLHCPPLGIKVVEAINGQFAQSSRTVEIDSRRPYQEFFAGGSCAKRENATDAVLSKR